jgi:hypothetical protein
MTARRLAFTFLAVVLCAMALIAAGCGGGDDNKSSSSTTSDAVQKCKDAAGKINNPDARKRAEDACNAVENGGGGTGTLVQQCLDAAKRISNADARKRAETACRKLG